MTLNMPLRIHRYLRMQRGIEFLGAYIELLVLWTIQRVRQKAFGPIEQSQIVGTHCMRQALINSFKNCLSLLNILLWATQKLAVSTGLVDGFGIFKYLCSIYSFDLFFPLESGACAPTTPITRLQPPGEKRAGACSWRKVVEKNRTGFQLYFHGPASFVLVPYFRLPHAPSALEPMGYEQVIRYATPQKISFSNRLNIYLQSSHNVMMRDMRLMRCVINRKFHFLEHVPFPRIM